MSGINSLMNIGQSALRGTQTAINVTGSNIANVNTEGYCRQSVRFDELQPLTFHAAQLGQGVKVDDVFRNFNRFAENAFLDKYSEFNRWNEQHNVLQSVESLFNEANRSGISSALGNFFQDWNDLVQVPDDPAAREALLEHSQSLISLINDAHSSLERIKDEMDMYISDAVSEVNRLLHDIQAVSRQIQAQEVPGVSNANALKDERDRMVRELAEYIDIGVQDNRGGDFRITTVDGLPLMDLNNVYTLETRGPRIENHLQLDSAYRGTLELSGYDSHEYTFEVLQAPEAGAAGSMRVSLDGGRTWLRNDDGSVMTFAIPEDYDPPHPIRVKDLEISFTADPTKLSVGDRFEVVPKEGLYWVSPTRDALNITPQILSDGTDNRERLSEGKLAAYYNVRDYNIGRYEDKLNAFADTFIWEVNKLHSQGAGMKSLTHSIGTYALEDARQRLPLGDEGCGLPFSDRLTAGNITFQIYDENGEPDGMWEPDFDPTVDGIQNFDPSQHTLQDVVEAINRGYKDEKGETQKPVVASIVNGRLQLTAAEKDTSFAVGNDTSGLLAALGVNTFFTGTNAADIALNSAIVQDPEYINAGKINANGKVNAGDNAMALDMVGLATKKVDFSTTWSHSNMALGEYYGTLVGLVGSEVRTVSTNASYNKALANDLDEKCQAISGVNLDEEMTALIKFQHSYTAAAKLITTADQMLQTLLSLKQ